MNKKYITYHITSINTIPKYLSKNIVFTKHRIRPEYDTYFILIESNNGKSKDLDTLINYYMKYQFTFSYFIIEAINEYKQILRDDKIKILLNE